MLYSPNYDDGDEGSSLQIASKYNILRKCTTCNTCYTEKENIGHLLCKIHPGLLLSESQTGRTYYTCCGLYTDAYRERHITLSTLHGCTRIDHIDQPFNTCSISERLKEIRTFATLVLPDSMINHPLVVKPLLECVLYTHTYHHRNKKSNAHKFSYDINILGDTILPNSLHFLSYHNYYNLESVCDKNISVSQDDQQLLENTRELNRIEFDIDSISKRVNRIYLKEGGGGGDGGGNRHQRKKRRLNKTSHYDNIDTWADIGMKGDNDSLNDASSTKNQFIDDDMESSSFPQKRVYCGFTIIRRIDNKLNITKNYSKVPL